ncbi:hypothetical protein [Micromonospora sp. NPDC048830]|uniref:hypothetical protein n=1 Tax=Micromonospora sp. NPDC048830 TaxID=3364257 RepID=UPI0037232586
MKPRRTIAATVVAGVVVAFGAACTSGGDFSESNAKTGVVVEGPKRALDGDLTVEEASGPPAMPPGFTQVGAVTKVTGRLKDYVTITLPIPQGVDDQQVSDLRVMRHDGASWGAMPPQHVDLKRRLVKVTTREFSLWGLGMWDVEQAVAGFLAGARNLLSSGSWWLLGSVGRFAVNPPITECRHPALTLQLDTSQFVDEAILCPKFVMEDKERHTYRLHISNLRGFPVMLRLPAGLKPHSVTPQAANPITQLMVQVGQSHGLAVLPGGGELVLDVNALDISKGARITGALDLTGVIMDAGFAILRVVTGYDPNDKALEAIGKRQEFVDAVACVMDQSERIAKQFHSIGAAKLAWEIFYAASGCMSTRLFVAAVSVYAELNYEAYHYDEEFRKAVQAAVKRVVTVIENAPVLTQIAATMLAAHRGKTTFALGVEVEDPAVSNLYKALPTPGDGGFQPTQGRSVGPANGGQLTYVGTPCMVESQAQPWATWTQGAAYARYDRDGSIGTSMQVAYVRAEHRKAVQALFTNLAGNAAKCDQRKGGSIVVLENHDGRQYGGLTDYRVGQFGWENSEYLPYGVVAAYDPTKGVVVHISLSADSYSDVDLDDIKEELEAALDYAANKLDVSLGTTYTLR